MTNDPDKSGKKDIARRYSDPLSALRAEMKMFFGLEGAHASGVSNFGGVEHLQEIDPSERDDDGCSFQGDSTGQSAPRSLPRRYPLPLKKQK